MALPKRKLTSMEEFIDAFPEVKRVIFDGTERPIQRSKDAEKQKQDYSGKKKRHSRTHLSAVEPNKRILLLSEAHNGKDHEKGILNQEKGEEYRPEEVQIDGDSGFQGLQKERANVRIPHKKPKGGELTEEQKEENRQLASERVVCEHAFAGVKRDGIASNVYRNHVEGFDARRSRTRA